MNPDWLFKHFDQISEPHGTVLLVRRLSLEYRHHKVQITEKPSRKLGGTPAVSISAHSLSIPQTPSAQLEVAFPMEKRLMEWAIEAESQSESGRR